MPTGIKLFSGKDNTLPAGINCSLKSTRTLGVTLSFKCVSHTHTLDAGWYKYGSRLKTLGKLNCSLKQSTRTHGVYCLLKVRRTHTHFEYRMVRIWFPTEGARKIESWGPGFTRLGRRQSGRRVSRVPGIPRRTSTRWSSSPGVIPGRVSSGIPGGLRHNSREFPTVYRWIQNSPEGGRGGPGGLESHQTLEWGWSLRPGVIPGGWDRSGPRGGDWIPGNSRLCSSVQIPQTMAMTRSIPTATRGVDTNRAPSSIPG